MTQLIYAMQFSGNAAPMAGSPSTMKAVTTASSCRLAAIFGPDGIRGNLEVAAGDRSQFESEVRMTGDTSFIESGSIRFGSGGHASYFSTVGHGYLADSPERGLKHGTVTWRVDRGEGQFRGGKWPHYIQLHRQRAGPDHRQKHVGLIFLK